MHDEKTTAMAGRSLSVLVVEDEFMIALDLELILEQNGHAVLGPASSVETALRLLEDVLPDVALLDLNLRGQLAFPVAVRLQEIDVPIVLSSAYDVTGIEGGEILAGAENIGKPVAERALLNALRRAVPAP